MKFRSILRTHVLAVGLGATLLLAGSARAQEITISEFDDGPFVVPFSQPVSAQAAPASTPVMTESQALKAAAAINAPYVPDQASQIQVSVLRRWVTAVLLILVSLLILFILVELSILAELKRTRRTRRSDPNPRVSTRTA